MFKLLKRSMCEEDGQDFAEYALILGITYENHCLQKGIKVAGTCRSSIASAEFRERTFDILHPYRHG